MLPPLVAHREFVDYLLQPTFIGRFGFTMMGRKVERHHLMTFFYAMMTLVTFVFIEVADGSVAIFN